MSAQELSRAQVMHRIKLGTLTQREAARTLRLSVRQIKRLWRAYRGDGARALISRRRGRPSNNRLDSNFVQPVVALVKQRYPDFGSTLARGETCRVAWIADRVGNAPASHDHAWPVDLA